MATIKSYQRFSLFIFGRSLEWVRIPIAGNFEVGQNTHCLKFWSGSEYPLSGTLQWARIPIWIRILIAGNVGVGQNTHCWEFWSGSEYLCGSKYSLPGTLVWVRIPIAGNFGVGQNTASHVSPSARNSVASSVCPPSSFHFICWEFWSGSEYPLPGILEWVRIQLCVSRLLPGILFLASALPVHSASFRSQTSSKINDVHVI